MTALEKRSITLAGIYAHARLLGWDARGIELGFTARSLQGSLGGDADNVASLKKFLKEHTGAALDVKVKALEGAPPPQTHSVAETEGALKRADRERREEEARAHPATAAVIEAFGAKIKEIKIDG